MWVGWVTPDYHQHDMNFDLSKVRAVTVTMGDEQGNVHSRYQGGVGTVGGERSPLGTWLSPGLPQQLPSPSSSLLLSLFTFLLWVFPPLLFLFGLFHFLFLHLTLYFLHNLLSLFSLPAPLPSLPPRTPSQLLRTLTLRGLGFWDSGLQMVGVWGWSSEVMVFWEFGEGSVQGPEHLR